MVWGTVYTWYVSQKHVLLCEVAGEGAGCYENVALSRDISSTCQ